MTPAAEPPVAAPAAYHGPGWRERPGTLADEITDGRLWAPMRVRCEYDTLTDVILHAPTARALAAADPDTLQHLGRMNAAALRRDLGRLADTYRALGIRVHRLPHPPRHRAGMLAGANAMYARDLFWMTGEGAVISRMASTVRAGEELQALTACARLQIPVLRTVSGAALFEGADALWLRPGLVAIGVGRRTNAAGARLVAEEARRQGADSVVLQVPDGIQHLLGTLQALDTNLLAVRAQRAGAATVALLRDRGFDLVEVPETPEVAEHYAFNFVVTGPRRVVMTSGSTGLRAQLAAHGVDCAAVVAVPELFRGAGGIGCATGILARRPG